jgi:hypothetical protein
MNHSFKALRAHEKDKKKMAQAMKTVLLRPTSSGGNIALLTELFQYDRKEAEALVLPMALQILSFQQQRKPQVIHLSTLEKELVPHLPKIYEFLDRPEKGNAQVRINVNILLNHLSPEHTKPVVSKMQNDLKSTRWELKLFAAQAILRTGPKDKAPLARALAETMTTPKLPTDFPLEEILTSLRALGPDGIAAVPSLRVAQTSARADNRARILLTMAALDPSTKDQAIGIGQKLYQTAEDKYAGAILLCELGVLPTDETLKSIEPFLTQAPMKTPALRLTQTLGAKAKPLIPILEAKLAEPRQLYPAPIAATLGRIDGNTKQMLDRLVQIARDDPKQLSNVTIECGRLGAAARPVVPALVEIHQKHRGGPDFFEALALIDPQALNRLKD